MRPAPVLAVLALAALAPAAALAANNCTGVPPRTFDRSDSFINYFNGCGGSEASNKLNRIKSYLEDDCRNHARGYSGHDYNQPDTVYYTHTNSGCVKTSKNHYKVSATLKCCSGPTTGGGSSGTGTTLKCRGAAVNPARCPAACAGKSQGATCLCPTPFPRPGKCLP